VSISFLDSFLDSPWLATEAELLGSPKRLEFLVASPAIFEKIESFIHLTPSFPLEL
jgi:hypothetical protein